MERTGLDSDDDLFFQKREASTSNINTPSSPVARQHFPSPLEGSIARQSRQYPEYPQKSYGLGFPPPVRRGSPLNPQKNSHRRSVQSNVSLLDSPPLRHRRVPSPGVVDMGSPNLEQDVDVGVFSNEYDLGGWSTVMLHSSLVLTFGFSKPMKVGN